MELNIENESQRKYGMGYEELMTPEQDQITMIPSETKEDPFRKDNRKEKVKEWILRGLTKDQIIDRLVEGFGMNKENAEQIYLDEAISGTIGKTIRILKGEEKKPIYQCTNCKFTTTDAKEALEHAMNRGHNITTEKSLNKSHKVEIKDAGDSWNIYVDGEFYTAVQEFSQADKLKTDIESGKKKISLNKATELPIYKIRGKYYYRDKRLGEYRNIKNPNNRIDINEVSLDDLETPTEADQQEIYGKSIEKGLTKQERYDKEKSNNKIEFHQKFMEKENTEQDPMAQKMPKDKYKLKRDCFAGKKGDIIEVDESGESSTWYNERTGEGGSPFIEYDIAERIS